MNNSSSEIDSLERNGDLNSALKSLKKYLITKESNDKLWHQLGRIYQSLAYLTQAKRSYLIALSINPKRPRTLNNLIVLELEMLKPSSADSYLEQAMGLAIITTEEKVLLLNSGCQLRIFQQRYLEALEFAQQQVQLSPNPRSFSNLAISLQWIGDLQSALAMQTKALECQLDLLPGEVLKEEMLGELFWKPKQSLKENIDIHVQLMNLGVLRLCGDPSNKNGQKLLLAGMGAQISFWQNEEWRNNIWEGGSTKELVLWDDQGFGDTIQNLGWIHEASKRAETLRLWLRLELMDLVIDL